MPEAAPAAPAAPAPEGAAPPAPAAPAPAAPAPAAPAPVTPPAGAVPPPAPAPAPAPTGDPAPAPSWTDGLNDDTRGYVETKGFQSNQAMMDSYRNLEKLVGQQDKIIKMPEAEDAQGLQDVFTKLGRPEKSEEYNLVVPQGGDPALADWAKGIFHEANMTGKQAEVVMGKWNERVAQVNTQSLDAQAVENTLQNNNLKSEWGNAHDQNIGIATQAAKAFGLDAQTIDKLEQSMGYAQTMKFMHNIGSKMGEGKFVSGDLGGGMGDTLTPEAANNKITALKGDKEFVQKYTNGDVKAIEEMTNLQKMANPGNVQ